MGYRGLLTSGLTEKKLVPGSGRDSKELSESNREGYMIPSSVLSVHMCVYKLMRIHICVRAP